MIKPDECLACEHKICADVNIGNFVVPLILTLLKNVHMFLRKRSIISII
ncbi:MAG: hypothetical protein A4E53_02398 [Pelotomaculum sp. PtaB.Bin104]|nr:MAG: hypothetical protein A4E53_02398 [Pelotomaculum sp. PtaB.Bin104]